RTARGIGPPPEFDGRCCSEPGCERRLGLETDHRDPLANGGPTSGENLGDLCTPHHWAKTQRDRTAGRLGGGAERGPPDG
ncbi:MAG TPA: HNH endonuclease signature motif containing protein, partial [Acidimicrobiia bacterium]|nr:HNH endonuclease signature motif containing protein [Acidimicrobiia bacterium]